MPRSFSICMKSDRVRRASALGAHLPRHLDRGRQIAKNFSVSVVLPASGCEMIAKVRRRAISGGNSGRFVFLIQHIPRIARAARQDKLTARNRGKRAWRAAGPAAHRLSLPRSGRRIRNRLPPSARARRRSCAIRLGRIGPKLPSLHLVHVRWRFSSQSGSPWLSSSASSIRMRAISSARRVSSWAVRLVKSRMWCPP